LRQGAAATENKKCAARKHKCLIYKQLEFAVRSWNGCNLSEITCAQENERIKFKALYFHVCRFSLVQLLVASNLLNLNCVAEIFVTLL
jgi:hypothetical protein